MQSSPLKPISCVYFRMFMMFLCPSICMTWRMSLVLWYSMVAFQCLKVWKWIWSNLGFWSFRLKLALCFWNRRLWVLTCLQNILSEFFFNAISRLSSLFESLKIRGLPPFSGVIRTVPASRSRSVHLRLFASPDLAAVSFRSWRNVEVFFSFQS